MTGHNHHGPAGGGQGTKAALAVTLAVNLGLTALKWLAFFLTGSPSLFGEAAHSTADSLNPILLWIGSKRGRRPADAAHPAGHGRETFFWSFLAAQAMFLIGAVFTALNGVETVRLRRVPTPSGVAIAIISIALLAESYSFWRAWKEIRARLGTVTWRGLLGSRDPLLLGILVENGVDMAAAVLALCGFGLFALTGDWRWDAGFSFAIAAAITVSAFTLMNRSRSLLVGEAAPAEMLERIRRTAGLQPYVRRVLSAQAVMEDPERVRCRLHVLLDEEWFREEWEESHPSVVMPAFTIHIALSALETTLWHLRLTILGAVPEAANLEIEFTFKDPN